MPQPDNRRGNSRESAAGEVVLNLEKPYASSIVGGLVDISATGFRATYDCRELERGDHVHFRHRAGSGSAIVIWTRIQGANAEAGFQITS